jgi:pilus assembly protein CpaE
MGAVMRAMIIDSDEMEREYLRGRIEVSGLKVDAAVGHGLAAAELAKETRPDVLFVSVEEPVLRALHAIGYLRATLPDSTIVACSSSWNMSLERRLLQAGANDFLHGKVSKHEMGAAVDRARARFALRHEPAPEEPPEGAGGRIITVIGQKGGIGKTTTSTNIAAAIARDGEASVLLIDLDTRFGDVAIMMDVVPEVSVSEVARDPYYLERDAFRSALMRHESGVYVLPAPRDYRSWLNCSTERVQTMVQFAATMFDYVVLDTPGTFNDIVSASIDISHKVVVVTSTDLTSLKNSSLLLEHLQARSVPENDVVVTLIHGHGVVGPGRKDVEYVIGRNVSHEIPYDTNVRRASQAGVPAVTYRPNSPAAMGFMAVASHLSGLALLPATQPGIRDRFFAAFGSKGPRQPVATGHVVEHQHRAAS